jgi:glycine/serine hydroxymethyltransferase
MRIGKQAMKTRGANEKDRNIANAIVVVVSFVGQPFRVA